MSDARDVGYSGHKPTEKDESAPKYEILNRDIQNKKVLTELYSPFALVHSLRARQFIGTFSSFRMRRKTK